MLFRSTSIAQHTNATKTSDLLHRLVGCVLPPSSNSPKLTAKDKLSFQSLEQRLVMAASVDFSEGEATDFFESHGEGCGCGCCGSDLHSLSAVFEAESSGEVSATGEVLPLESLPILASNPDAEVTLYLDFDGHYEASWGSFGSVTTPVFSLDNDFSSFNSAEIDAIVEIWQRVSEDFAPFNVNVTTVEPSSFANGDSLRVAIGGSSSWYGSAAGGLAYVNSFTSSRENTVYVFPENLAKNAKYIAEASSHEAGHGFGLKHQSTYVDGVKQKEYNPGSGDWAPIMGVSYYKERTTWHDGTTTSSTTYQDDMSVIARTTNGFGYRTDDHGGLGSATSLNFVGDTASGSGIIELMSDQDAFAFTTSGGSVELTLNVAEVGANLDGVLELWTASGEWIATADPSDSYGAVISTDLAAGDYILVVTSTGEYGSVGQFTVTATVSSGQTTTPQVFVSGNNSTSEGSTYNLSLSSTGTDADPITEWIIDWGDGTLESYSGNPASVSHTYADGTATYTIEAVASNSAGTYTADPKLVMINNVDAVLSISGAGSVLEGDTYTLNLSSSDPGQDTINSWTINWGDGTIETINGDPSTASHIYALGGLDYTISASATDEDGTYQANSVVLSVTSNQSGELTAPSNLVATHDNGVVTIQWSDNTSVESGYVLERAKTWKSGARSDWSIVGSYAADTTSVTDIPGKGGWIYRVRAAVDTNGDGAFNIYSDYSNEFLIKAWEAPLDETTQVSITGNASSNEGAAYQLNLASSGSGADGITEWTIDWGDGTVETVSGNPNSLSHVYADGTANYTIQAFASDSTQNYNANNLSVTINNVAAQLQVSGSGSVHEGETYTLNLSSSDPGQDTISSWTINWGDGTIETINGDPSTVTHVYAVGDLDYTITATATDEDGTYQAEPEYVTVTADSTVDLQAPTNLTADYSNGEVLVNWQDNSTGETGFVVERAKTWKNGKISSWDVLAITDAGVTSFTDTSTTKGGWVYRVRAVADTDGDGGFDLFSDYSNIFTVKVPPGADQAAGAVNGPTATGSTISAWEAWAASTPENSLAGYASLFDDVSDAHGYESLFA